MSRAALRTAVCSETEVLPAPLFSPTDVSLLSPWASSASDVASRFQVVIEQGLSESEAMRRRASVGPNALRAPQPMSILGIARNQLTSVVIWLLVVAAVVSAAMGDALEAVAIAVAVVLAFATGFVTELRAVRSMEALRKLGSYDARVRRGGVVRAVTATNLVPGDVVVLEAGDRISADLRVVQLAQLQADESILTGESIPTSKRLAPVAEKTTLADRSNMLFKGTNVARGSGIGIVVGTGMDTELGRVAALVDTTSSEETPLEQQLAKLGRSLLWACLGIVIVTAGVGILGGRDVSLMFTTAIALAVAAIPEGLLIVATIALARGMMRLAGRHALIKKLSAVETLGATNVILVDKTGTLTANQLEVVAYATSEGVIESAGDGPVAILEVGALCNNASLDGEDASGDPLEIALLRAAARSGIGQGTLAREWPRVREFAFDPQAKMMATVHRGRAACRVAVKGAAEAVLEACSATTQLGAVVEITPAEIESVLARVDSLARTGLRVLAFAERFDDSSDSEADSEADGEIYAGLTFLGLVGFADPPRGDVAAPIAACHRAGIRVIMATGDQASTAASIAKSLAMTGPSPVIVTGDRFEAGKLDDELRTTDIFARVAPDQKLAIVDLFQRAGSVVAMTGDGVNDAPALRRADIGIAMGLRGTDVARDAADMVLVDDSFESIVVAIEQGRAIFENIRRFVIYLLSCNLSEVLIVAGAVVFGAPLPLLPLQILFLNLVTDVFPALALGFGQGSPNAMNGPPRVPGEPIVSRKHWGVIGAYALLITLATLAAMMLVSVLGANTAETTTVAFLTLGFAQLWHVFNLRDAKTTLLASDVVRNRWVWGAVTLCVGLLVLAATFVPLTAVLDVQTLGLGAWVVVLTMSLLPLVLGQLGLFVYRRLNTGLETRAAAHSQS